MGTAIVTGSGGLIGSESVQYLVEQGFDVVGLENDMRSSFFGPDASTRPVSERLVERYPDEFRWVELDIRDAEGVDKVFAEHAQDLELIVHTAAQPSHDWAASDPQTDFGVNANGTLNLLEATRQRKADATFVFCSTNKVYGDRPNFLPLQELDTRLELPEDHEYYDGIPTSMSIDESMHSLFGVSKAAADLMVQEYGRYFEIPTVCFRGGCLTGPNHAGAQLHGFLAYLLRCTVTGDPYTVFGYGAKQVRDNIHSADVVSAFAEFHKAPKTAAVYNLGGGQGEQLLNARGDRAMRADRGTRAELGAERPGSHGRPSLVDQRPACVPGRLSRLEARVRRRGDAARELRAERGAMDSPGLKISTVIPAHNEEGSIEETIDGLVTALEGAGIDYEILVVDDSSTDRTRAVVQHMAAENPRVRYHGSHLPRGFGFTVRAGLDAFEGDAVAIVMADASDDPADLVRYHRLLEEGYDCAFGSRFMRGGAVHDYPRIKLIINRLANSFIRLLFRHGYNDTTNAFKAYRREVIETVQPLLSNHFNLTVELPLKAIVRGHSYGIVPITWRNRQVGTSKLSMQEMGSRYLFIVLYALLERYLSRGDYVRPGYPREQAGEDSRRGSR